MTFYEIEMLSIPTISFACDVETSHYENQFFNKKDFLEISCEHSGLLLRHDDGREEIARQNTVTVFSSDLCCRTFSHGSALQRHTTVGVKLKYRCRKYTDGDAVDLASLQQKVQSGNTILLPHLHPLEGDFEKAVHLIRTIIISRGSGYESAPLHALSAWFSLTAFLTDHVIRSLGKDTSRLPPSEYAFAAKASQYITLHIARKITVEQIADHLGISAGYLHRIFRNIKGCGVIHYINCQRVAMVKELIQNKNFSLKQAAKTVGIEDTAYMSRLFKKVTGSSFRQYYQEKRM